MELKMAVWSPELALLGLLEKFKSVVWEEKAYAPGSFSVEAPATPEVMALLAPENILWLADGAAGIVEYLETTAGESGIYVTAKGPLLSGVLGRRILWGPYSLSGTPQSIMTQLVKDCAVAPTRGDVEKRRIPQLALREPSDGGQSIRKQKTGGSLSAALEELGEAFSVAYGVAFDPDEPKLEFWTRPGVDRTVGQAENAPVFFSTELDDVLSSQYSYSSMDFCNTALVAGEGEGAERAYVTVPDAGEPVGAGFIPSGSTAVMLTADGREFLARAGSVGEAQYRSAYTGAQIDQAVEKALGGGAEGGAAGVSSFNGRTGAVVPKPGDYTAGMVGAATVQQVNAAIQAAILDSWEAGY